jgi:hypothetical protein
LDKEQLPGLQLFAGDEAEKTIKQAYKIRTIPRFILVGKDGNLISADASRPSSESIRAELNAAIAK